MNLGIVSLTVETRLGFDLYHHSFLIMQILKKMYILACMIWCGKVNKYLWCCIRSKYKTITLRRDYYSNNLLILNISSYSD